MNALYVFLGGGLGAVCRYAISLLISPSAKGFPYATLIANFASSLILGILIGYFVGVIAPDRYRLLLITGFCGGFSTFSTFSAETYDLINNQSIGIAIFYILTSVITCLVAIGIGIMIGKFFS